MKVRTTDLCSIVQHNYTNHLFIAVILKWHHQLKSILLIQDRLMNVEDQSTGIHEEIHFWQDCLKNLHHIRQQLQSLELQNIIEVLTRSKSAYLQQFLHVEEEVQVKRENFSFFSMEFLYLRRNEIRNSQISSKIV